MIAALLCLAALVGCYLAGRSSLGRGLVALLVVGYFYGILRANLLTAFSHFIFDAGLIGLYLSQNWMEKKPDAARVSSLRTWVLLLIGWPLIVLLMPFQPLLISFV